MKIEKCLTHNYGYKSWTLQTVAKALRSVALQLRFAAISVCDENFMEGRIPSSLACITEYLILDAEPLVSIDGRKISSENYRTEGLINTALSKLNESFIYSFCG